MRLAIAVLALLAFARDRVAGRTFRLRARPRARRVYRVLVRAKPSGAAAQTITLFSTGLRPGEATAVPHQRP